MSRFSDQWNLFSYARDNYNLDNIDHSGYKSYLENYPLPYEAVIYIIESLKSRNSLLRKKIHESKQRYHSFNLKFFNQKDIFNSLMRQYYLRYTFELLTQDLEFCNEARGYLLCIINIAKTNEQRNKICRIFQSINSIILSHKI